MIARLRRRHARMTAWVGVVALVGLLAALAARPSRPVVATIETAGWSDVGTSGIRALRERRAARQWVSLETPPALVSPDPLVYWTPREDVTSDLPGDVVLLGPLGDRGISLYELPVADTAGSLVVYSLGHDVVLAAEPLISIQLAE